MRLRIIKRIVLKELCLEKNNLSEIKKKDYF